MFSILVSTFYKDKPTYVREALESLTSAGKVYEVVVVADYGTPIKVIEIIDEYKAKLPIKVIQLTERTPLGESLNIGLRHCSFNLVARFDSDDINTPSRFEHQLDAFNKNPDLAIVGGSIVEFESSSANHKGYSTRSMPLHNADILSFAKWRCPFNHQTVMYRRDVILELGGYNSDYEMEDYDLWVRLLQAGYIAANLSSILVLARAGKDLAERRGGIRFLRAEYRLQKRFYLHGFISLPEFIRNLLIRCSSPIAPTWFRHLVYRYLLRDPIEHVT